MQNPLTITGIVLLLLAGVIIRTQLGAKNCPSHTKIAGILAWIVAIVCLGAGIALIAMGEPQR